MQPSLVRAALAYVARVYAAGWMLGPPRELVLVPRIGRTAATAGEGAIMAAVTYAAARKTVAPPSTRIAIGALGLAVLCGLEAAGRRLLPRRERAVAADAIFATLLAWFALAPLAVGASTRRTDQ
jgi:hypothetical protein